MACVEWQIRPLRAAAAREMAERLWRAAMPLSWPVLPAGIGLLDAVLVAEAGTVAAGLVAVDPAGTVPLILVDPSYQRRGIGASLLHAAVAQIRAAGVTA
jgi:GNAT superfamily N-acetyltransferase